MLQCMRRSSEGGAFVLMPTFLDFFFHCGTLHAAVQVAGSIAAVMWMTVLAAVFIADPFDDKVRTLEAYTGPVFQYEYCCDGCCIPAPHTNECIQCMSAVCRAIFAGDGLHVCKPLGCLGDGGLAAAALMSLIRMDTAVLGCTVFCSGVGDKACHALRRYSTSQPAVIASFSLHFALHATGHKLPTLGVAMPHNCFVCLSSLLLF